MSDGKMSEIIKASLDGIKDFADVDTIFGSPFTTEGGVTIVPVSKITFGFAGGGIDMPTKKIIPKEGFGGGSGAGISVSPVAFLTVKPDGDVSLIPLYQGASGSSVEKILDILENAPEIIEKIKNALYG